MMDKLMTRLVFNVLYDNSRGVIYSINLVP